MKITICGGTGWVGKKPRLKLKKCESCGTLFKPIRKIRRFCSRKCMYIWRSKEIGNGNIVWKNHKGFGKGKDNPNWKGGVNSLNETLRKTEEYKQWRRSVFARDHWTCVWCDYRSRGSYYKDIHADHIKPFSSYPELRNVVSNGRTLCVGCHMKTFIFWKNQFRSGAIA